MTKNVEQAIRENNIYKKYQLAALYTTQAHLIEVESISHHQTINYSKFNAVVILY